MRVRFAWILVSVVYAVCNIAGVPPYSLHLAVVSESTHPPAEDLIWYCWEPSLGSALVTHNEEIDNLTRVEIDERINGWASNQFLRESILDNSATEVLKKVVGFYGKPNSVVEAYIYGDSELLVAFHGFTHNQSEVYLPQSYTLPSKFRRGFLAAKNNCSGGIFWSARENIIIDSIHNTTVQHLFMPIFDHAFVVGVAVWVLVIPSVELRVISTQSTEQTKVWQTKVLPFFLRRHPTLSVNFESVPIYGLDSALTQGAASPSDMTFCLPYTTSISVLETLPFEFGPNFFNNISRRAWTTVDPGNSKEKYYCLPVAAVNHGFFYNKDLFKRLNLSIPTTISEFRLLLQTILVKSNHTIIPLSLNLLLTKDSVWDSLNSNFRGGEVGRQNLESNRSNFKSAAYVDTFAELAFWAQQGFLGEDWLLQTKKECIQAWMSGQAAIIGTDSSDLIDLSGRGSDGAPNFEWGVFAPPKATNSKDCYVVKEPNFAIGMLKGSQYVNESLAFLQWLTTNEFTDLVVRHLPGYFPLVESSVNHSLYDVVAASMEAWKDTCQLTIRLGTESSIIKGDVKGFRDLLFTLNHQVMIGNLSASAAAAELYSHYRFSENIFIDINATFQSVMLALSLIHALALILTAVVLTYYRTVSIVRSSSFPMLITSLVGAIAVVLSCNLYSMTPSDSVCGAKTWMTPYFLIVAFGPLFLKQWRVHVIFSSANTQAEATVNTDKELATGIVMLLVLQSIVQLVALLIDGPSHVVYKHPGGMDFVQPMCSEASIADAGTLVLQIAMYGIGAVIAFRARHLPSQFNETRAHLICLLTITCYCLFCLPLAQYLRDYVTVSAMLKAGGLFIGGVICHLVLFGPKMQGAYAEFRKRRLPPLERDLSASNEMPKFQRSVAATTLISSR